VSDSLLPLAVATLDRTALALIVGAAAAQLVLLPLPQMPARAVSAVPRLLLIALALFACSSAGELVLRTAALADVAPGAAWPFIGQALTHSEYGTFWKIRAVTWIALVALVLVMRRKANHGALSWGLAAGAAVLIFAMSSTGHGGNDGTLTLFNLINTLHITGACLWGGTVVIYVAGILPCMLRGAAPAQTVALTATRLSTLAAAALALVLATGAFNAWHQIAGWSALWTTDYGRALQVKLAAVSLMMAIGATNRFFIVPAIERWAQQTADGGGAPALRFLRVLRLDAAVFVFVLACASVLGSQVPPAHMRGGVGAGAPERTAVPDSDH